MLTRSMHGSKATLGIYIYLTFVTTGIILGFDARCERFSITNGRYVGCNPNQPVLPGEKLVKGTICEIECEPGFATRDGRQEYTVRCEDSQWVNQQQCIVQCSDPGSPANGRRIGDLFTQDSTVRFECEPGFMISGDTSIECKENRTWTHETPSCEIVHCSDLNIPTNGKLIGDSFTYGSQVQFECNQGYKLSGLASVTCTEEGAWSEESPSCEVFICKDPGVPANGKRIGESFVYGSAVAFECNSGYQLSGVTSIVCEGNGTWSDEIPICEELHHSTGSPILRTQRKIRPIYSGNKPVLQKSSMEPWVIVLIIVATLVVLAMVIGIPCYITSRNKENVTKPKTEEDYPLNEINNQYETIRELKSQLATEREERKKDADHFRAQLRNKDDVIESKNEHINTLKVMSERQNTNSLNNFGVRTKPHPQDTEHVAQVDEYFKQPTTN